MRYVTCVSTLPRRNLAGAGLIEVLVAVLVLSVGMLGLAGLQLWSLRNNQSSMERSLAVVQTHSIVDAMRADRATAEAGGFNLDVDAAAPAGVTFAQTSLAAWRTILVSALGPQATGGVSCANNVCTIRVRWNDQRAAAADSTARRSNTLQEIMTQVRL